MKSTSVYLNIAEFTWEAGKILRGDPADVVLWLDNFCSALATGKKGLSSLADSLLMDAEEYRLKDRERKKMKKDPDISPRQYCEQQPEATKKERQKKEPIDTADFERFWASYPKRVDKKGALRSWQKENPNIDLVISAIESQKANWTDPQFIPMPTTWLNQRRFEAQIDAISKPPEEEEDRITMWKRHFGMPL